MGGMKGYGFKRAMADLELFREAVRDAIKGGSQPPDSVIPIVQEDTVINAFDRTFSPVLDRLVDCQSQVEDIYDTVRTYLTQDYAIGSLVGDLFVPSLLAGQRTVDPKVRKGYVLGTVWDDEEGDWELGFRTATRMEGEGAILADGPFFFLDAAPLSLQLEGLTVLSALFETIGAAVNKLASASEIVGEMQRKIEDATPPEPKPSASFNF